MTATTDKIKQLKPERQPELVQAQIVDDDWSRVVTIFNATEFNASDAILSFVDVHRPIKMQDFKLFCSGDFRSVRIEDTNTNGEKTVNTIAVFGYNFKSARSRVAEIFAVFLDTKFKEYYALSLKKFLDWIFHENDVRKAHVRLIDRDIMIKYFSEQGFDKVATLKEEVRTSKGIYEDVVIMSKIVS